MKDKITMANPLFFLNNSLLYLRRIIMNYKNTLNFRKKKKLLISDFNKLNWSGDDVWEITKYSSGSLDEAIRVLTNKLIDDCKITDCRLYPIAKTLIKDGFKRGWK